MTRWYRAYVGTVNDPKLAGVAHASGATKCEVIAIWHFILERAAEAMAGGKFKMDANQLCGCLGVTVTTVTNVWGAMIKADMVTDDMVLCWKKRQYETDIKDPTSAERQARWKAKHLGNGSVTVTKRPDTDTDSYKRKKTPRSVGEPPEFLDFWASVPKKVGRHEAMLAYIKAGESHDFALINAAAKRWNIDEGKAKTEEKYIPRPSTWLNKRRYMDYHASPEDIEKERKIAEFMRTQGKEWVEGKGWVKMETTQ